MLSAVLGKDFGAEVNLSVIDGGEGRDRRVAASAQLAGERPFRLDFAPRLHIIQQLEQSRGISVIFPALNTKCALAGCRW